MSFLTDFPIWFPAQIAHIFFWLLAWLFFLPFFCCLFIVATFSFYLVPLTAISISLLFNIYPLDGTNTHPQASKAVTHSLWIITLLQIYIYKLRSIFQWEKQLHSTNLLSLGSPFNDCFLFTQVFYLALCFY